MGRTLPALLIGFTLAQAWPVDAEPETTYVPEFVCAAAMSTPGVPARSCSADIAAGHWHVDMDTLYLLDGSFRVRVVIPSGRSFEWGCTVEVDLERSRSWCGGGGSLGDEAGSTVGPVSGNAYLHVTLPSPGTVTLSAGEGIGIAIVRGASASSLRNS